MQTKVTDISAAMRAKAQAMKTQQRGSCALPGKQSSSSQASKAESLKLSSNEADVMTAVTARLIPVIGLYYPAFAARFGTDEATLAFVSKEYTERLMHHGINGHQFKAGIAALKARGASAQYHPNPEQFAHLCLEASAVQLPEFHAVLNDVIAGKQAQRFGEEHQFIHPIARVICGRKADLIYTLTSIEFEEAIRAEYDHWTKRLQAGEQLPEPQLAIGHDQRPEMPAALRLAPTSAMAKRVQAMAAEAAQRKEQAAKND